VGLGSIGAMTFIRTVPQESAEGLLAELYARNSASWGFLPNYARAFSLRPEAFAAWEQLAAAVSAPMDRRRYELVTIAAARALRNSYCLLAHTRNLAGLHQDDDRLGAIVTDHRRAGLEPVDVAVMSFADKLTRDPSAVTAEDVDGLRGHGLSDEEVLDVVLIVALRNFFTRVLDGVGAQADRALGDQLAELADVLVVGRPVDGAPASPP
jgi:uncharacterized peroxidase-related enzyme